MEYLVLMEVGKKQSYIFKSNKIRENIGASQIIQYVTEELPNNKVNSLNGKVLMNGGGKSLYSFVSEEDSINFVKNISSEIIKNYPGLDVYFVRDNADYKRDNYTKKIEDLYEKLGKKKAIKKNCCNQVSLGIEKVCSSTGLPAVAYHDERVVSKEIDTKIQFNNKSIEKSIVKGYGNVFSRVIDDLKGDEKSYVAIVHIDGNSMGNKFIELAGYWNEKIEQSKENNYKYIDSMKKLSSDIENIYKDAFDKVIEASLVDGVSTIRPIILAGDDVTFVCKAESAIMLSRIFLENVTKSKVEVGEKDVNLNAAVGIAFTKAHYPFSRAYDLAEQLCSNCKMVIKSKDKDTSMIDWHILQGETSASIQEIREQQYKSNGLTLNIRPIYFNDEGEFNNLENFEYTLNVVNSEKLSRNKIKALRSEYAKGQNAVKVFLDYYKLNSKLDYVNNLTTNGAIYNNRAIFFDAIEIMDLVKEV